MESRERMRNFDEQSFRAIRRQKGENKKLDHSELLSIRKEWKETKEPRLFDRMFRSFLYVAYILAKNASEDVGHRIEFTDAYQSACMALMRAIAKFEPGRRRFATYACKAMKNGIRKEELRQLILSPKESTGRNVAKFWSAQKALRRELGRAPATAELATRLNWSEKRVCSYQQMLKNKLTRVGMTVDIGREISSIFDLVPAPEPNSISVELAWMVAHFIMSLNERDRAIAIHRLLADFLGNKRLEYPELGRRFGISPQYVHLLTGKLRDKLKRAYVLYNP